MTWTDLTPPYRTIVMDPPWSYPGGVSAGGTQGKPIKSFALPYSSMSVAEIQAMPVLELAEPDSWWFLWTTNRYLPAAFGLLEWWGLTYRQMLVWNKLGPSPFGGTFAPNGAEFLIGASRGSPELCIRWPGTSVITASRNGDGKHSTKPAAFLDLVEAACPGPYVELFARQPRLGWDSWGWGYENQAPSPPERVICPDCGLAVDVRNLILCPQCGLLTCSNCVGTNDHKHMALKASSATPDESSAS